MSPMLVRRLEDPEGRGPWSANNRYECIGYELDMNSMPTTHTEMLLYGFHTDHRTAFHTVDAARKWVTFADIERLRQANFSTVLYMVPVGAIAMSENQCIFITDAAIKVATLHVAAIKMPINFGKED